MPNYKELLGDKFKEGMSAEDTLKALEALNLADLTTGNYVAKGKFDAKDAEIANLKKTISGFQEKENANLTDAQKKEVEFQNTLQQIETLKKENAKFQLKEQIMSSGFSAEECKKIIDAQESGKDTASVYAEIMKSRVDEQVKSAKAEMLKRTTPPPPNGSDDAGDDIDKDESVVLAERIAKANSIDTKSLDSIKSGYSIADDKN